ncbi:hypothetical protein OC844_006012 [Tilletia horrida]|nr:hypothetical protein OC844_006012 [Tilletia horrida]
MTSAQVPTDETLNVHRPARTAAKVQISYEIVKECSDGGVTELRETIKGSHKTFLANLMATTSASSKDAVQRLDSIIARIDAQSNHLKGYPAQRLVVFDGAAALKTIRIKAVQSGLSGFRQVPKLTVDSLNCNFGEWTEALYISVAPHRRA